jgi:hypothetical protein
VSKPSGGAAPSASPPAYTPPRPDLVAFGFCCLWIAILSLPMWSGQLLAGANSDQHATGYAIRLWGAMQWRATGHPPQWNPMMVGGVPVFAGFGDLFYPTAWLRLVMPTVTAMNIAFVAHYLMAGFFVYLLLRMLGFSWLGSVVAGTAYQLSGVVVSYVSPGHDGKLFVTALLPLMLIGLVLGIRRRRLEGHALLGLAVGLALLSPQYQTAQYALIVAGIFALYLAFGEPLDLTPRQRWNGLALALAGVLLGFGVSLIQVLPFYHYIPFSARAGTQGFEWSASYGTPWIHVPEFFLSGFTGVTDLTGAHDTYWGPNALKLHSEYLGLPVILLAVLGAGAGGARKRLVRWIGALAGLFLLVSLGGGTPFYRLWWALVPYVNKTRAPGIAFYVVALAVSILAAAGVERLERREGRKLLLGALGVAGLLALLGAVGTYGAMAQAWAEGHQAMVGHSLTAQAQAAQPDILWGAVGSCLALALLAGVGLAFVDGKIASPVFGAVLALTVGGDLWRAGARFWQWSRPEQELYTEDPVVRLLKRTAAPYRALDPTITESRPPYRVLDPGVYPGTVLMRHNIAQVLGYHGFELSAYDDLLDKREGYRYLGSQQIWKLLAVRYVILPDSGRVPGYHRVLGPVPTASGRSGHVYEADTVPPYARVAAAAVKASAEEIVPTLLDPRLEFGRIVLFDPTQPVNPLPLTQMPPPSPSRATVTSWAPGKMSIALDPAPPAPSFLVVAENWYPDWHASVDGTPALTYRGDQTLITVPLPTGARSVSLVYDSHDYRTGKKATFLSLLVLALGVLVPPLVRRRRRG